MAVSKAIQEFSDRVDVATSAIAAKIQALTDKLKAGTPLTPEDVALLDAEAAKLEAMGKDAENPV